jgi:glycyl-tRNA synthetase
MKFWKNISKKNEEVKGKIDTFSNFRGLLLDEFKITKEMISINKINKLEHGYKYYPRVIEPSFGVGRILYALLEHSFSSRHNDENRKVLSLLPIIAPIKVTILPMNNSNNFIELTNKLTSEFIKLNISNNQDISGASIGKKYARADEIGTLYAITIDFDTFKDDCVTIRERDTTNQVRIKITDVISTLYDKIK